MGHMTEEDEAVAKLAALAGQKNGPMVPPTESQVQYVLGLQDERVLPDEYTVQTAESIRTFEKDVVSRAIDTLKRFPYKEPKGKGKIDTDVPAGRYALNIQNEWQFYQVDKPTDGRWKGYTFVKRLIGAPGNYRETPIKGAQPRETILRLIERDPRKASLDYGIHERVCGVCHSPLTNEESRELGIGPVCRTKMGW